MKANILILGGLLTSSPVFSQLGINTSQPQGIFHIDGAKDNPPSGIPSLAQQDNDLVVTKTGSMGIGTTTPTEKLDIQNGNVRIRTINTNKGIGGTDRTVVSDATGVLKTIGFNDYSLFHARLAQSQALVAFTVTTLKFAAALSTSPFYSYDDQTGFLTFKQPGNYLVILQASFTKVEAGTQLILGIRPVPEANYLARGSHFTINPTTPSSTIGELMNYTTILQIPTANYTVRFTTASFFSNNGATVLATESGSTGSGNVTSVTIQKI